MFETGIRPLVDAYLAKKAAEERDYGDYWSGSSAGYCMRKNIFDRLGVPPIKKDARKQRVFSAGKIFHDWIQEVTREAGVSIAQEVELQDEDLMIRGHFDDLVLVPQMWEELDMTLRKSADELSPPPKLILYDYKTQNSRAFSWQKDRAMSHYHKMQLGTYMYMLRKDAQTDVDILARTGQKDDEFTMISQLTEARILKISKDDLRMTEDVLLWTPALEKEVVGYWKTLNGYWDKKVLPKCTCADREGGFLANPQYNDYYYNDTPCSIDWYLLCKKEGRLKNDIL